VLCRGAPRTHGACPLLRPLVRFVFEVVGSDKVSGRVSTNQFLLLPKSNFWQFNTMDFILLPDLLQCGRLLRMTFGGIFQN
jgi:hypothetical protein